MNEQLHAGKLKGTGESAWHSNITAASQPKYWCGDWCERTAEELYAESESVLADLEKNHSGIKYCNKKLVPEYLPPKDVTWPLFSDADKIFEHLANEVPWVEVVEARREQFMSDKPRQYTYGRGLGQRTYASIPFTPLMQQILDRFNAEEARVLGNYDVLHHSNCYNVCFLNRYDHGRHQLGWHADDSPEMDHDHPIAVASFGAAREIWWRRKGVTGVTPPECRQLLGHGSIFIMPPGFQCYHEHRIPRTSGECLTRISLTFRRYLD